MMRKIFPAILLSSIAILSLSACESAKEELGLTRKAPDEFAVIKRAPLVIPTNLVQLPIPQPGAPRPQEKTAQEMAAEAIFGPPTPDDLIASASAESAIPTASAPTAAEQLLLQQTGAAQVNPQIRQVVNAEADEATYEEQAVIDKLFDRKVEAAGSILDPEAEAARLKANQAAGQPLSAGDVKTLKDTE